MAKSEFQISVTKIAENFQLEEIYMPENGESVLVSATDVNRPGLQMVGFFDYFDAERIQILGKVEYTYSQNLLAIFKFGKRHTKCTSSDVQSSMPGITVSPISLPKSITA